MADDKSTDIGGDVNINDGDFVAGNKTIINQSGLPADERILARLAEIDAYWLQMIERVNLPGLTEVDVGNCIRMIDQVDEIRLYDPLKSIERLKEIQVKIDGDRNQSDDPWVSPRVREYFEEYIRRNDLGFLSLFFRLLLLEDLSSLSSEEITKELEKIGSQNEISRAIEWAISDSELPRNYKLSAVSFLQSTYKAIDYRYSLEYLEQLHWSSLLHSWSTILFWRRGPSFIRSRTLEIGQNAFVSQFAESDPFLFPPGQSEDSWEVYTSQPPKLRPEWYQELRLRIRDPRLVFVVGDHGFGKTAAALMLAWDELLARANGRFLPSTILPVYIPYRIDPSIDSFLSEYALAYAKTLMGYLAATPYEFLLASVRQQTAMAMLLVCCLGSLGELRGRFSRHRRHTSMPSRFFDVLKERVGGFNTTRFNLNSIETEELLSLLFDATPDSVIRRLPLVDIQSSDTIAENSSSLPNDLIPTLNRLTESGMGATVFVSRNLANQILLPDDAMFPVWTYNEITQLLENRLSAVTRSSQFDISVFCDFRSVDSIEDIQRQLIESSHMLPGRLIEIVQRFIGQIEKTNTLLNQKEIDDIFDSFL